MSTKRTTWQAVLIRTLCVLMLIQGTPLLALQEGAVTVRPDLPVWLQEIIPSWPWIVWLSDPSVSTNSRAPAGGSGSSSEPAPSSAKVENPPLDWTTLPAAAIFAHPGAREATPQPTARQPARRFTKADREAGSAHNPSRERLPEGAQSKVAPRAEIPTKGIPSALVNLVEELHRSPSEIFAYVHDHFDYDPRWGVAKPPLQTLREKRGTAWELTWLLRDLLSAVGIDSRFEWGEIELSPKGLESIAGIDDVYRAADLIATGGTPIRLIIEDDEVVAVRMRHVWLLAYLDYVPNRGRWVGEPDYWVRMGPTFKRYEVDEGARLDDAVPFALGDYLQSGSELSPRIAYEEALGVHLDENAVGVDTVDDVKRDRTPLKEDFVFVPGSLRGYVRNVEGSSIGVPAEFMNRLELRLSEVGGGDLLTWSTDLAALYAKPLELAWAGASSADQAALDLNGGVFATPPYEVELAAKLRLGGAEVVTGGAVGSAADVLLTAVVTPPDGEPTTTEFTMFAGEHAVLAADLGLVPQEVVDLYARRQSEAPDATEAERWALAHASTLYLRELGENNAHLSGLRWQRLVNLGNVVLAVQRGAVSRSPDGTPLTFSPAPPALDLGAMTLALFPPTGDPTSEVSNIGTMELLGSHASMLEAEVWMEVLGGEHVSAVPALTRAVREGQTLTRVDATNLDAALSAAELSAEAEASVEIGVGQGRIAWIPESQIRVGTWDVTGYVLENPTTGAAGYLTTYERILEPLDANLVIHSPIDLDVITSPIDVVATIEGEAVDSWTLSTRPAGGESMTEVARGNGSIANATLGRFDPTLLLNGLHELVLTARDGTGRSLTETITLSVEGNMKIGNFTLSFIDLALPLAGLDIEVIRTYDSRRRAELGDFGQGWFLDIRQGSYRNNRPPGDGWQIVQPDGSFSLPCSQVLETKSHVTTIRLSDHEIYRFRLALTNPAAILGGCVARAAFEWVDGPFRGATLEILGNDQVFYENAGDRVLDSDALDVFEPDDVRLTTRDGRAFHFDLRDGVTRVEDANENVLDLTPEGITHSSGRGVRFVRDALGRLVEIIDPLNRSHRYQYDATGDLVSSTDRADAVTRFLYTDGHFLEEVLNPLGARGVRTEYDAEGRLVRMVDGAGQAVELAHEVDARREVITNRRGFARVHEYDERGNVVREIDELGQVTGRTFDDRDRLLRTIDPTGAVTQMAYDGDNLVAITDANGHVIRFEHDGEGRPAALVDALGNITRFVYDAVGNLSETIDPLGHRTRFTYNSQGLPITETDALGHVTHFTYDVVGRPLTRTDPTGAVTRFAHDSVGDLLSITSERARPDGSIEELITTFERDSLGRILHTVQPDGSTTATTYNLLGDEVSTTDPLGRVTTFGYDLAGNQTTVTFPDGLVESWSYDAEGYMTTTTDRAGRTTTLRRDPAGRTLELTLPDGAQLQRAYDAVGRIVRSTDPLGNVTTYAYDPAGRRIAVTNPLGQTMQFAYDAAGNRISTTNAAGETITHTYDAGSRRVRTVLPDGAVHTTEHDALGRPVARIDPAGARTEYRYDPLDRLIGMLDAMGGETAYAYDALGGLLRATDANGHSVRFERDALGRVTRRILADGSSELLSYDLAGNLASRTDFLGRTTTWLHDALDRWVRQTLPDGETVEVTYTAEGQRASVTDARGTTTYTYDLRDRQVGMTTPEGWQILNQWDLLGRRTELSIDLGILGRHTSTMTYDAAGRRIQLVDAHGGVYSWSYDAVGRPLKQMAPNGIETTFFYDPGGDLTQIQAIGPNGNTIQQLTYTLGATNARRGLREHDGTKRIWDYDLLDRLVGEKVLAPDGRLEREQRIAYDATGNRLSETLTLGDGTTHTAVSTYDARDRLQTRTVGGSTTSMTWDANGNLLSETTLSEASGEATTTYTWDAENHLLSVALPDGSRLANRYDADGTRIGATWTGADGTETDRGFVVDTTHLLSQVLAEVDGDRLVAQYTYGPRLLAVLRGTGDRYAHTDVLGSVRALSNGAGQIKDRYAYTAFGELLEREGEDPNTLQFLGEPSDPASGLVYLRARWLSNRGTFLSMDPETPRLFEPLDLATYLYAHGNPVNQIDPLGRQSMADVMATLNTMANLSRMSLRVLRVLDKVQSVVDMLNLAQFMFNMAFNGGLMTLMEESMGILTDPSPPGSWGDWTLRDATDSLSFNLNTILGKTLGKPYWPLWLTRNAQRVQGMGLRLPSPFRPTPIKKIKTSFRLGDMPLSLILGGKGGGSITGVAFVTNHRGKNIKELWRMDFHKWHRDRGLGTKNANKDELSVWTDKPFHYHVLLPPDE